MQDLRVLRRYRSLTCLDLAALTGIPAREIAEVEFGLRQLRADEHEALAFVLGLEPHEVRSTAQHLSIAGTREQAATPTTDQFTRQTLLAVALAATVATGSISAVVEALPPFAVPAWGAVATIPITPEGTGNVHAPLVAPAKAALAKLNVSAARDEAVLASPATLAFLRTQATVPREAIAPPLLVAPTPGDAVAPAPQPGVATAPTFTLTEQGPRGCPVQPAQGRVVLTQGYGEGSHAPAQLWGAVDLAVDGNGDGEAEPGASWYVPVVATHDGRVTVTLNSVPAGNHVWVNAPDGRWRTGYSHLALVTVISGQFVRAGEQLGLMGSSGETTGPHLDYQLWRNGINLDPTELVTTSDGLIPDP